MKNTCIARIAIVATSTLLMTSCASITPIEETPAAQPMAPMQMPVYTAGQKVVMKDLTNGEVGGYEFTSINPDDTHDVTAADGCSWTSYSEWFAPPVAWDKCGAADSEWYSGTQEVEFLSGSLWPLTDGNSASYRKTSISSKGTTGTPETRECEVAGPVSISISSDKTTDAMKVTCKTRRWDNTVDTRVWYWNAEHGELRYRRSNNSKGIIDDVVRVLP